MHAVETGAGDVILAALQRTQTFVNIARIIGALGRPADAEPAPGRLLEQFAHLRIVCGRNEFVAHHFIIIIQSDRFVSHIVKARRQPLVGVNRLLFGADIQIGKPAIGGKLENFHFVVRVGEGNVFVRARAVQLQRFVEQAQRGEVIPFVQAGVRHFKQFFRRQIELYYLFFHS